MTVTAKSRYWRTGTEESDSRRTMGKGGNGVAKSAIAIAAVGRPRRL